MTNDAAFLRAIQANRDDPACRLIYADWLEERGDPRAEFLRLSCRLAELQEHIDPAWLSAVREGRFHANEIRLRSGRDVTLRALRQFRVYEGLLEGLPTAEMNQQIIDRIIMEERNRLIGGDPYLIRPEEKPIKSRLWEHYPFGNPASLPSVACIGRFQSHPARDSSEHASELVIIWFQEDFAPPLDASIWPKLLEIDWERHAVDFSY